MRDEVTRGCCRPPQQSVSATPSLRYRQRALTGKTYCLTGGHCRHWRRLAEPEKYFCRVALSPPLAVVRVELKTLGNCMYFPFTLLSPPLLSLSSLSSILFPIFSPPPVLLSFPIHFPFPSPFLPLPLDTFRYPTANTAALGKCCNFLQRVLGRSPKRKRIWFSLKI